MTQLPNVVVGAIVPACIYALIAVGFVLTFRATKVFNFAQGSFVFIGALLFVSVLDGTGSVPVAIGVAVVLSMLIGAVTYLVLIRPLTGKGVFVMVMITLILGTAFLDGIIALIWGVKVYPVDIPPEYRQPISLPFGATTDGVGVATFVATALTIGGIGAYLKYARFGIEMRAAAESTILASYSGVPVVATAAASWAVAFGMASLAGIATAAHTTVDSNIVSLGLYAFPAIILGGMDSVPGALIGAFVLALLTSATATFVPSGAIYTEVVAYSFMLVVLMVRPYGLFGTREFRRL